LVGAGATERATGTRLHAPEVAAAAGISQRRAYELLRAVRGEDAEEQGTMTRRRCRHTGDVPTG
jgi:hypothetical protein